MRVEVGVKESSKKKLVRSILVGHVEKMGDENLTESNTQKVEGKWRRRRPKLRRGLH